MTAQIDDRDLDVTIRGDVAIVTMLADRRLNAMRQTFWVALRDVLTELEHDDNVLCVVVTGEGARAFSAGGDIHGYAELLSAPDRRAFITDCMRTFEAVETFPKPVIGAVNGVAFGGGFELLLACDVVISASSAKFGVPESRLGLAPGFGILRLLDHLSPGWTRYLVFTGEHLDATTAERLGLVQVVVPDDELLDKALAVAGRMAESAPLALAVAKATINSQLNTRYLSGVDAIVMLQSTDDAAEGIVSFQERRPPQFKGR